MGPGRGSRPGPGRGTGPGPRARLEAELREALERAGATERTIASVMGAGCRLDGVGQAGVSAELTAAGARLRERIRQLADALDRIDVGAYGRCESCGMEIDAERLNLLPTTRRCRGCAAPAT